jgi:hypothetical protein
LRYAIIVCMTTLLLTSACQTAPPPNRHATYTVTGLSGPDHQTYRPGDKWLLTFQRSRNPVDTDEPTPLQITITAELIGPFSSVSQARQNLKGHLESPPGPVVVFHQVHTTDWSSANVLIPFQLPSYLAPGTYDFVEILRVQDSSGAGTTQAAGSTLEVVS